MNLKTESWKFFEIGKLFSEFQNGKANQGLLQDGNDCVYIGAKRDDNGVMLNCKKDKTLVQKGNCIIFICNGEGSVGFANYMDVDFIGTTDIVAGYNDILNEHIGIFLATIFSKERPKYSFGRKWKKYLKQTEVLLPAKYDQGGNLYIDDDLNYSNDGYVPDWQFMEDYIKSLNYKPLRTKNKNNCSLNINKWKEFSILELFDNVNIAKSADIGNLEEGCIPFVGRTDINNGIQGLVTPTSITKGKCITISMVGTNVALYQESDFQASQNIAILRKEKMTKEAALFICSLINFEIKLKYSYGRTIGKTNIEQMILKLPIDSGSNPNWKFMEKYIKSLPYGDRL